MSVGGARRPPSLRVERQLLREAGVGLLAGVDEVGRGALAGPVSVGVVLVDLRVRAAPGGLADSKELTARQREALVPGLRRWARGWAVGHASPAEVDEFGIIAALRLAGLRALADLPAQPELVLLDGSHDWLTVAREPEGLFGLAELGAAAGAAALLGAAAGAAANPVLAPVRTLVRADARCASVAAASVLAKTTRDALMLELAAAHPAYGWAENKGYASPQHLVALREHGTCALHRRSWSIKALAMGENGQEPARHRLGSPPVGTESPPRADGSARSARIREGWPA